jgi:acetolactate synthase-1/2/3 large subunit
MQTPNAAQSNGGPSADPGKLMTGAEMLLECLGREGVDVFFGYPGGVTLPFYDAVYESTI